MGHEDEATLALVNLALVNKDEEAQASCFLQGRVQMVNLEHCLGTKKHEFSRMLELAKILSV